MAKRKKTSTKAHFLTALTVTRSAIEAKKLVYVLTANKKISYSKGKSRIVYIGTTTKGLKRVASSAAAKAVSILTMKGINKLSAYILTYKGVHGLSNTHKHLERAAITVFKLQYGDIPLANKQGVDILSAHKEFKYFDPKNVLKKLNKFEELNEKE